jgi:hypothetical protein
MKFLMTSCTRKTSYVALYFIRCGLKKYGKMKFLMTSCTRKTSNVASYIRFFIIQLIFLPYFPNLITIQLSFLPYVPYPFFIVSNDSFKSKCSSLQQATLHCISYVAVWKSTVKWNFLWRHVRGKQVMLPVIFVLQSFTMLI